MNIKLTLAVIGLSLIMPFFAVVLYGGLHLAISFVGWELYPVYWPALRFMLVLGFAASAWGLLADDMEVIRNLKSTFAYEKDKETT